MAKFTHQRTVCDDCGRWEQAELDGPCPHYREMLREAIAAEIAGQDRDAVVGRLQREYVQASPYVRRALARELPGKVVA